MTGQARKVLITGGADHPGFYGWKVLDKESGLPIAGVTAFRIAVDVRDSSYPEDIRAQIDLVAEVELTANADIRRFRLDDVTGKLTLLSINGVPVPEEEGDATKS